MKGHGWLVMAVWMATAAACLGGQGRPTVLLPDGQNTVTRLPIVVLNYSEVGKEDIELAVEIGRRVFHRMSIETTWHVCRRLEECALPPAGSYLRITIIPEAKGTILGFADPDSLAHGNPLVYILFAPVDRLAKKTKNDTSDVLAYVMVHEALHLFGLQHAQAGIMRASFGRQDLKTLATGPYLSSSQVQQLYEGMSRLRPARPQSTQ